MDITVKLSGNEVETVQGDPEAVAKFLTHLRSLAGGAAEQPPIVRAESKPSARVRTAAPNEGLMARRKVFATVLDRLIRAGTTGAASKKLLQGIDVDPGGFGNIVSEGQRWARELGYSDFEKIMVKLNQWRPFIWAPGSQAKEFLAKIAQEALLL